MKCERSYHVQGRRFPEVEKHLLDIWTMTLRAMDDIKDSVRAFLPPRPQSSAYSRHAAHALCILNILNHLTSILLRATVIMSITIKGSIKNVDILKILINLKEYAEGEILFICKGVAAARGVDLRLNSRAVSG
jgi:hypothetical protein